MHFAFELTQSACERASRADLLLLKRRVWTLGAIAAIAPCLGLLASMESTRRTIIAEVAENGYGDRAGGFSEDLVPFALSLVVTVLAMTVRQILASSTARYEDELRREVDTFVRQLSQFYRA